MAYPEKGAKYAGQDRAKRYRADGGAVGEDYAVNTMGDALLKSRTAGENRFIEDTRKYPYRLGLGPAASEEHLGSRRRSKMKEALDISDSVPRRDEGED